MKTFLRILLILIPFFWSIWALAQKKQGADCTTTCFSTEILSGEKISETCTTYKLKISYSGDCRYALSHFTAEIPCGEISDLSNSQKWKQELGTDPTTGLSGFKIDDIPGFGETSLKEFTVQFTLCSTDSSCSAELGCWKPLIAYKASTCVIYDTLPASCTQLTASLQKENVSCFGKADGALSVDIDQGQEPFTFLWSDGSTTPEILNLAAGKYSVVITDASGSELILSDSIQQPTSLSLTEMLTPSTCSGIGDGAVDITIEGGAGNYTFLWSNGSTSEDIDSLSAGIYSVQITDQSGCSLDKSFTIANTTNIIMTSSEISPDCNDASGAIDITVSGGSAPYSYVWSNGEDTEDISDLSAGHFSVVITDSMGCSFTKSFDLKDNNTLKLTATSTQTSCLDNASGSIDLTVEGGTAPFTYSWSNGAVTEDLSGLPSGYYTVTVTDANGCKKALRVYISKKTFIVPANVVQPLCPDESTGSVTLQQPVGGTGPYTYEWSTGETGNSISDLGAGTYSVVVTDSTGCSRQLYFVIINPTPISASASVLNSQCNREGFFSINISVSGGAAPYNYLWSDGSQTEDREFLNSGDYSVIITDANECSITHTVTIHEPDTAWSCLITTLDVMPVCESTNNSLSTEILDADAYAWVVESADSTWAITAGNDSSAIRFTAGRRNSLAVFTVTVTKNGCSQTCSYTVSACTTTDDVEEPGEEDPEEESCDECFNSSITTITSSGSCYTYEAVVNTNGNCRHELSHWSIAIPCGQISNVWNSGGWKMETGTDPTTGVIGLKVDDINNFGKSQDSFTVRFTLCYETTCNVNPETWNPVVAYKAGLCIGYDSAEVRDETLTPLAFNAYPNPFADNVSFEWRAQNDDIGKLEILNQFGQTISTIFEGKMDKGQRFRFDWVAAEATKTVYYYKLTTGSKTACGKLFRK